MYTIFILPPVVSSRIDKSPQVSSLKSIQFGHPWHASDRNGKTFVSNGPHPSKSSDVENNQQHVEAFRLSNVNQIALGPTVPHCPVKKKKYKSTHTRHNSFCLEKRRNAIWHLLIFTTERTKLNFERLKDLQAIVFCYAKRIKRKR